MMSNNYTSIDSDNVSGSVSAVSDSGHVAVKFQESNLQTFPPSQSQGKISSGSRPPRDADDTFSKPISGSEESQSGGWFQGFTICLTNIRMSNLFDKYLEARRDNGLTVYNNRKHS